LTRVGSLDRGVLEGVRIKTLLRPSEIKNFGVQSMTDN